MINTRVIGLVAVVVVVATGIWLLGDFRATLQQQTLNDLQGNSHQLLNDKPVLINIWATDCLGCVEEMPKLDTLYKDYASHGFRVIAVAMQYDKIPAIKNFVAQLNLSYPIVYDAKGTIIPAIAEVYAIPMSFLVDGGGRLVAQSLGEPNWADWRTKIEQLLNLSEGY